MNKNIISLIIVLITLTHSYASSMNPKLLDDPYIFYVGKKTLHRIDSQNQLLFKKSREHLNAASLKEGQIVWDIGCGTGAMTLHLAQAVGKTGHVYALDKCQEQIDYARAKVEAAGLSGIITFIHTDITAPDKLPFDKPHLIYMRHILMHIRQPENVLQLLKKYLKKDGAIVIQEPIVSTAISSLDDDLIHDYFNTLVTLGEKLGVDYDIGYRLKKIFYQVGFSRIVYDITQPHVKLTAAIQPLTLGLDEWGDKAIQLKITTSQKIDQWISTIANWTDSENSFFAIPEQIHLIAYK